MHKLIILAAALLTLSNPLLLAQTTPASAAAAIPPSTATPAQAPSFDVATIKPHPGMVYIKSLLNRPDGFAGTVSLSLLVQYAYGLVTEDRISGVPDWAKDQWFDIQAKIGASDMAEMQKLGPAESNARRAQMMQTLLADRFKLKAHSSTKQVPAYELIVAKGGSKLIDAATDPNPPLGKGQDGKPSTGIHFLKDTSVWQAYSMKSLAGFLSQPVARVGRPVLDKTGLPGTYDFTINWSVYSAGQAVAAGGSPDDAPSIADALKDVGLRLQPATGPIDIIVIDHAEKPSPD
jgi:uncharacterized protein (TIGR03435 family)